MADLLIRFIVVFIIFLFGYYLIPVSIAWMVFFRINRKNWKYRRIRKEFPGKEHIYREISWSMLSILIFSVLSVGMLELIDQGKTRMYFEADQYGYFYFLISPVIAIIIQDTYYYWLHRAMHHPVIFRYVHRLHHKSVNPTPWSIYAFQPLEAVFTYFSFAFAILVIPMHPVSLSVYLLISLINNIGGHTGFEILPSWIIDHKIARYSNVVTFHDQHHSDTKYNYGAYFNIWDRLMKTMHPRFEETFRRVKGQVRN